MKTARRWLGRFYRTEKFEDRGLLWTSLKCLTWHLRRRIHGVGAMESQWLTSVNAQKMAKRSHHRSLSCTALERTLSVSPSPRPRAWGWEMVQQKLRPASRSLSLHGAGSPTARELREDNLQELWDKVSHFSREKRCIYISDFSPCWNFKINTPLQTTNKIGDSHPDFEICILFWLRLEPCLPISFSTFLGGLPDLF